MGGGGIQRPDGDQPPQGQELNSAGQWVDPKLPARFQNSGLEDQSKPGPIETGSNRNRDQSKPGPIETGTNRNRDQPNGTGNRGGGIRGHSLFHPELPGGRVVALARSGPKRRLARGTATRRGRGGHCQPYLDRKLARSSIPRHNLCGLRPRCALHERGSAM